MKIFNAIDSATIVPMFYEKTGGKKLNILISYAYQEGNISDLVKTYRHMIDKLYLDSGAYSVFTGFKKISLPEYTTFLRKYGDYFDRCFSLDDRFDNAEHNYWNQTELEEALKDKKWKPIPVVHDYDDPYAEFKLYVKSGHKYIALGSMGAKKKLPKAIKEKIKKDFPDIHLHMFGDLNLKMLMNFRPHSADSAGWAHQAGMGGSINYWRSSENKPYSFNVGGVDSDASEKNHIKKSPFYPEIEQFMNDNFGYSYQSILSDSYQRQILNLYFFTQVEEYINELEAASLKETANISKAKVAKKKDKK